MIYFAELFVKRGEGRYDNYHSQSALSEIRGTKLFSFHSMKSRGVVSFANQYSVLVSVYFEAQNQGITRTD